MPIVVLLEASIGTRCHLTTQNQTQSVLGLAGTVWQRSEEQGAQEADRAEDNRGQETPVEVSCDQAETRVTPGRETRSYYQLSERYCVQLNDESEPAPKRTEEGRKAARPTVSPHQKPKKTARPPKAQDTRHNIRSTQQNRKRHNYCNRPDTLDVLNCLGRDQVRR